MSDGSLVHIDGLHVPGGLGEEGRAIAASTPLIEDPPVAREWLGEPVRGDVPQVDDLVLDRRPAVLHDGTLSARFQCQTWLLPTIRDAMASSRPVTLAPTEA
jgi:hypothetical protein